MAMLINVNDLLLQCSNIPLKLRTVDLRLRNYRCNLVTFVEIVAHIIISYSTFIKNVLKV